MMGALKPSGTPNKSWACLPIPSAPLTRISALRGWRRACNHRRALSPANSQEVIAQKMRRAVGVLKGCVTVDNVCAETYPREEREREGGRGRQHAEVLMPVIGARSREHKGRHERHVFRPCHQCCVCALTCPVQRRAAPTPLRHEAKRKRGSRM